MRIRAGKQHAKLSLLVWSRYIRIILASANLTVPGYRSNYEVAGAVDLKPEEADTEIVAEALGFLRRLLMLVPGAEDKPPEVQRAEAFLSQAEREVKGWKPMPKRRKIWQQLICTLPAIGTDRAALSSLEGAVQACRKQGGSPNEAWIASPFFDDDTNAKQVTASLCKLMARGEKRKISFCVPAIRNDSGAVSRLAAPIALLRTPPAYHGAVTVKILPEVDGEKNLRPWHAKMLALRADQAYSALMIGSSNFTQAGMGVGTHRNAEANLLTIVQRVHYRREISQLEAVWPDMEQVSDPKSAEWLGAQPDQDEEECAKSQVMPAGFLSATYRAGSNRQVVLRLAPDQLPEEWSVYVCGREEQELMRSSSWQDHGRPSVVEVPWGPVHPPQKLLVRWADHEAFMPLNVDDSRNLPPPAQLEHMSADDMLTILAAADPSAAYRVLMSRQGHSDTFETDPDSEVPIDLDPLRRYDLHVTFLHRIRHRARVLAQLRSNLERPVWGRQALEWRLKGILGVDSVAEKFAREVSNEDGARDESLLALADFLIILQEVEYQHSDGSLSKAAFEKIFRDFLGELTDRLGRQIDGHSDHVSKDVMEFWKRVADRCRE